MMEILPNLKLTFQEGTNPKHYALNIKVDEEESHPHLMIDHNGGNMIVSNSQFEIVVEMGEETEGVNELDIDLGSLEFDSEESEVKVLIQVNGASVGENTIKVKEAQQESRPIL